MTADWETPILRWVYFESRWREAFVWKKTKAWRVWNTILPDGEFSVTRFGEFKCLWPFVTGSFSSCQNFETNLAILMLLGKWSVLQMAKYLIHNQVIWSHWWRFTFYRAAIDCRNWPFNKMKTKQFEHGASDKINNRRTE